MTMMLQIEALVDEAKNCAGQVELPLDDLRTENIRQFRQRNVGKLVLEADMFFGLRYQAAILGAGFRREDMDKLPTQNLMWDEVMHNTQNDVQQFEPGVVYSLSDRLFAITQDELHRILEFDYDNLDGLATSGFDLLYERED